jgi:hypothetical protein
MAKYGPGLTSGQIANMEKEMIKHALQGELQVGEEENGIIYELCEKSECDKYIIDAYDALYCQLEQALASGRALEKIAKDHGYNSDLAEYMDALKDTAMATDYEYEEGEE